MRKIIYIFLICFMFSCKSVDNWNSEPVLDNSTVEKARNYVDDQTEYIKLIEKRDSLDIKQNLTVEQLDDLLKIEKHIALSSRKVVSSWFDFNLQLRQDLGYSNAYRGHYYFRKSIEALDYSEKMKKIISPETLKDSLSLEKIRNLEVLCRLSVGEIAAYNTTLLKPEVYLKELKKLYKSMN